MTTDNDSSNQPPETQQQRWLKYGANVVLSSVVVIVLAGLLVYLAQKYDVRHDTTMGGTQSLRPQTVDFLKGLDKKIRIIAIYPRLKSDSSLSEQDYYTPVADLLSEYSSKNPKVTTEIIDPDTEKDRFTKLVAEVTNNYGGNVKNYKEFLANVLPDQNKALVKFASDEVAAFNALPLSDVKDQDLAQAMALCKATLVSIPKALSALSDDIDTEESQPIPSYKDCTDEARQAYSGITQYITLFSQVMTGVQKNADIPQAIRDYAPGAATRATDALKNVLDMQDRIQKLPPLKELLEFREQLKSKSIIIMVDQAGQKASTSPSTQPDDSNPGYKILAFASVWQPPQTTMFGNAADTRPHLNFAGEQQITASIATLVSGPRPMVVFVRPSGAPLTTPSPEGQDGPFSSIAERMKEYNFDVEEKDASGQSAAQGGPPEPTDDQMQSAIWIVLSMPSNPMMGPSPVNAMLQKHLTDGGSALLMLGPGSDEMSDVLSPWGVAAKTSFILAHEPPPANGRRPNDPIEAALQQNQTVFAVDQYGDSPLATPLQGLPFLMYLPSPISVLSNTPPGVKVRPIFPMPLTPHYWASSNAQTLMRDQQHQAKIVFSTKADPDSDHAIADIDNTIDKRLYVGAASEKSGAGRLVVVGTPYFAFNDLANIADADRPDVRRFPGNGEFFMDSVFWLAHMDSMLAISPHALEIARITDMSPASLAFWRIGVLTAGLPALVIIAGFMTYVRRRD